MAARRARARPCREGIASHDRIEPGPIIIPTVALAGWLAMATTGRTPGTTLPPALAPTAWRRTRRAGNSAHGGLGRHGLTDVMLSNGSTGNIASLSVPGSDSDGFTVAYGGTALPAPKSWLRKAAG